MSNPYLRTSSCFMIALFGLVGCASSEDDKGDAGQRSPEDLGCEETGDNSSECETTVGYESVATGERNAYHLLTTLGGNVGSSGNGFSASVSQVTDSGTTSALVISYDEDSQEFEVDYPGDAKVSVELGSKVDDPDSAFDGWWELRGTIKDVWGADGGGDVSLVYCNLDEYLDRVVSGDASTDDCDQYGVDPGVGDDEAGQQMGCTQCVNFDEAVDNFPAFRRVVNGSDDPAYLAEFVRPRLAATHFATEQMAQFVASQDGDRAAALPIIVALAAVMRFKFDVGSFHFEFGSTQSSDWRTTEGKSEGGAVDWIVDDYASE